MSFEQIMNIARREYLARVRNKMFILMTLMVPAIMAASFALPMLMARADVDLLRISIVDVQTDRGEQVAELLRANDTFEIRVDETRQVSPSELETTRAALAEDILADELDGYVLLEADEQLGIRGRYFARETGNIVVVRRLESNIRTVVLDAYLSGTGLDSDRVNAVAGWDLEAVTVSAEGEEQGGFERAYISTFIFAFILYLSTIMGGTQMGMSIVEEKSSRLIELILGAVTSTEFIAGKVVGVLGAALTQMAIWLVLGMVASLYVLPTLAVGVAMQEEGIDLAAMLDPMLLIYFAIFFILGYAFYAVLFAVIGSMCATTEEFTQVQMPAMMPIMLSFFFIFYVITNPATTLARVISMIPFATPIVMLARINVLTPPFWEILLSIALLTASIGVAIWAAAKVFRFTLLASGKRMSFGTVLRLIRAA